jgi:hypothetical protein
MLEILNLLPYITLKNSQDKSQLGENHVRV